MTVSQVQEEIIALKKKTGTCILAHAYQSQPILEVADFIGDSYGLSVQASKVSNGNILMCGVRFMAETCKVLCPDKKVVLANPIAGCPMAEQLDPEKLEKLKAEYPGYQVVAYINTTAELKACCDVCVTSSSAVKICKALPTDRILFIPDPNLGAYVAEKVPEKQFAFYNGGCPRHYSMGKEEVQRARVAHPGALMLVHPECRKEVTESADFVGSTTEIMDYAKKSSATQFIIATEVSITEHLQYELPRKKFYSLSAKLTCADMRATSLMDVYNSLLGVGGEEILLPENIRKGAEECIHRMIELG